MKTAEQILEKVKADLAELTQDMLLGKIPKDEHDACLTVIQYILQLSNFIEFIEIEESEEGEDEQEG
jgi:hypothetical protein